MRVEIENWWKQAKRDLLSAENSLKSKDYYLCAFMCQQSVEKGLKALYIRAQGSLWKVHDLVKLAREVKAPEEIVFKCAQINPVYVAVRYPESNELPSEKISKTEAERMMSLAAEVLKWIRKKLL